MNTNRIPSLAHAFAAAIALTLTACASDDGALKQTDAPAASTALPGVEVDWTIFRAGGQPTVADLEALAAAKTLVVVDLRGPDENRGYNEAAEVERLGMKYVSIPLTSPDDINSTSLALLKEAVADDKQTYLHCGSGQRAGAFIAYALASESGDVKSAIAEGRKVGLSRWEEAVTKKIEEMSTAAPASSDDAKVVPAE